LNSPYYVCKRDIPFLTLKEERGVDKIQPALLFWTTFTKDIRVYNLASQGKITLPAADSGAVRYFCFANQSLSKGHDHA